MKWDELPIANLSKARCFYCERTLQPRQGRDCPRCGKGPFHRGCLEHLHSCGLGEAEHGFGNRHED